MQVVGDAGARGLRQWAQSWKMQGADPAETDRPLPAIADLDRHLAAAEVTVPGLRPGCEGRLIWAGAPGVRTRYVVLNIHGFTATPQEIRPLPDMIAAQLGANLYMPRLTGHGQDGAALVAAGLADWMRDIRAAVRVAQMIGDEVILIGCSNGAALATLALAQGLQATAAIFISPHFAVRKPLGHFLLNAPTARHWVHLVVGRTRELWILNELHRAYWTTTYPVTAVYAMGDTLRAVRRTRLSHVKTPLFLSLNEADRVSNPRNMRKVAAGWGGPVTLDLVTPGPGDDPLGHVMAGDVFSPAQTVPMAGRIGDWLDTVLNGTCEPATPASGYAAE